MQLQLDERQWAVDEVLGDVSFTDHIEGEVSVTLGSEFPLAGLYGGREADAVQTFEVLQLCQRASLAQQGLALV